MLWRALSFGVHRSMSNILPLFKLGFTDVTEDLEEVCQEFKKIHIQ